MNISKNLLRATIVFAFFAFASCTQEDLIDELIKSTEIHSPSDSNDTGSNPSGGSGNEGNPNTDPIG